VAEVGPGPEVSAQPSADANLAAQRQKAEQVKRAENPAWVYRKLVSIHRRLNRLEPGHQSKGVASAPLPSTSAPASATATSASGQPEVPSTKGASVVGWRGRWRRHLLLAGCLAAWLLIILQWGVLATDRFVSSTRFVVRRGDQVAAIPGAAGILGSLIATSGNDLLLVQQYFQSADFADELDRAVGLRATLSESAIDWWSRLSPRASREDYLALVRSRLVATYDDIGGTLVLEFESHRREDGPRVLAAAAAAGERFLNDITTRMMRARVASCEAVLAKEVQAMRRAKLALLEFQREHGILDPDATSKAQSGTLLQLGGQLSAEQAKLAALRTYLSEQSVEVKQARAVIEGIIQQMDAERERAIGRSVGSLREIANAYHELTLDTELAVQAQTIAQASLEAARVELDRQAAFLVMLERPREADEALRPRRLWIILTATALLLVAYGIVRMIVATIREHRDA
jgi:capsular polysaccharide transport system permease protein